MNVLFAVGLGLTLLLTGCFAKVQTLPAQTDSPLFAPLPDPDVLIGLAVSGGGSRAAIFAAGALEALAEIRITREGKELSALEMVTHMSSVSGGSLATAYYALKKPSKAEPFLDAQGLTQGYRTFFTDFKAAMQMDFQTRAAVRQLLFFRMFNPTKFAYSFSEVWDSNFFDDTTFSALFEREQRGDSPQVILNGTSYNTGRRVSLTTIPASEFDYDFAGRLVAELKSRPGRVTPEGLAIIEDSLAQAKRQFPPLTFDQVGANHRDLRVSLAVATSASFPPIVGPVTYQVADKMPYYHIGDGGLYDNLGTESLSTVFLKKIPPDSTKKGLIIVIDASYPFGATGLELDTSPKGFEVFKDDPSRIVSIMEERANAYQMMLWNSLRTEGVGLPDFAHLRIVNLKHTDADWIGYQDLPQTCRGEFRPDVTPEQIKQTVSQIPTLFKIKSPCDGALLIKAAQKVVEKYRHRIVDFLQKSS